MCVDVFNGCDDILDALFFMDMRDLLMAFDTVNSVAECPSFSLGISSSTR